MLLSIIQIPSAVAVDLAGIDIHGFISQGYLLSGENNHFSADTTDGSFQFNELGINFGKSLTDELWVGMQLFSRDLGRTGNNEVEIDWAFGDYRWRDWLGIRAGLMKMPHGLYNESRDQDMVRTSILIPQSVYPEMVRDYYTRLWGVGLYGNLYHNAVGNLSYKFLVGNYNPNPDNSGLAIEVSGGGDMYVDEFDHGIIYSSALVWDTPLEGFRLGATAWIMNDINTTLVITSDIWSDFITPGSNTHYEVKRWSTVYSAEYTRDNLRVAAEYRLEHTENKWADIPQFPESEVDAEGYYLGASYRFTDWFELGSYYSIFYPDMDDRDGNSYTEYGSDDFQAWSKDFALSTWFTVNEYWSIKLEGHIIDGAANLLSVNNPDGFDQHDYILAAKVTFNF